MSSANRERSLKALHGQDMQPVPLLSTSQWLLQNTTAQILQIGLRTYTRHPVRPSCLVPYPSRSDLRNYRCLECIVGTGIHKILHLLRLDTLLCPKVERPIMLDVYHMSLGSRFGVLSKQSSLELLASGSSSCIVSSPSFERHTGSSDCSREI